MLLILAIISAAASVARIIEGNAMWAAINAAFAVVLAVMHYTDHKAGR